MYKSVCLLSLLGCALASPSLIGILSAHDDGQWRPWADNSALGSGLIQWGHEDGSWKPHLDGSILGDGHLTWLHRRRRSLALVNPNALPVPLDTAHVALAKNAQLIQQATEGTRNILGGGIPLALPADTHEVAIGKQAHAIAHAAQTAATTWGHGHGIAPLAAVAPAAHIGAPLGLHGLQGVHGLGLQSVHGIGAHGLALGGVHGLGLGGIHGLGLHGVRGLHGGWW
ncbi:Hypothetical protein NTJ_09738 [Nesidiocoris tenuis]|uniref:Uncharacterized protein n=1 Tax=Nesidiocoris tenuis TaxID=355587 RepID=A0ABN7AXL7_9HEMI|nr:Hypothetical protein NTJ_09738 [Nesidiocoris tenuis]